MLGGIILKKVICLFAFTLFIVFATSVSAESSTIDETIKIIELPEFEQIILEIKKYPITLIFLILYLLELENGIT